ncbi:hypothetical protein CN206_10960 [Sinorhizobium meliloti]|uniref:hypothetical protein n=1 Tax=Rhizobium meliloti TaxID=382 RepID=UPI000FD1A988|nr:hypothetical protein [Sinorhizobium meliloti]RVI12561.1 hypothetical protein CN206_10960 [Sinorhizobium meliloti]
MSIIIDPEIRILPEDHRIYVLHPGRGKLFYNDFIASNSVFLDLPGIQFESAPLEDSEAVRNRIRMARRISGWIRSGGRDGERPSRNPEEYAVMNPSPNPPKVLHAIIGLYGEARPGDLIVVPGRGYNSTVWIGEFVGDFDPEFKVSTARYPFEPIPARRVAWLPAALAKSQFNRRLVRLMQNRQAIIQVSREEDRREIYNIAYGDYVWGDTSGNLIQVTHDEIDLYDLNKAVDLTNYFASQYIALKDGRLGEFLGLGFHEAIERFYDKRYFGGVNVEIHSPGYFGRPMKVALLAGYVSAMLALSGAGLTAQEAVDLQVQNSANSNRSFCDEQLEADLRETMEMYANLHLWEDIICPRREATKNTVGLRTGVVVKKQGRKAD